MAARESTNSIRGRGTGGGRGSGRGRGSGGGRGSEAGGRRARGKNTELERVNDAEEGGYESGGRQRDEESYVRETYEDGESSSRITYHRRPRSSSEGIYKKQPELADRDTVHFLSGKGIREPGIKKTLSHIARVHWGENTHNSQGAEREAFLNTVVEKFKLYYKYPEGCTPAEGDYAVKEHLSRNLKYLLNPERKRADKQVQRAKKKGNLTATRLDFKPHYFDQRTWINLDKYWNSPLFMKRSDAGRKAQMHKEVTARTGAKTYSQKWEEMEEEKKKPITALEFANAVYKFDKPGEQAFMEKLKQVESSQSELQLESFEPPSSPKSQKQMHKKNEYIKILQARPARKGKTLMYPWHTVGEFFGRQGAGELLGSQPSQNLHARVQVPESVYSLFPRVLTEVSQMVISLPMREVGRALLDEEIRNLADVAFSDKNDPVQQSMWSQYVRTAESCLDHILTNNNKVVVQGSPPENNQAEGTNSGGQNQQDEDVDENADEYDLYI